MEQQGANSWYGGSQQQYGGHPHPSMQWQVRPETQHYNQPPPMHPSQQQQQQQQQQHQYQQPYPASGGYYAQPPGYYVSQSQQVLQAPAPQPAVPTPQHGMMYGQAEQAWPSSNGWSQQQWPSAGNSTPVLSQEEEWAAKARAWAASKAAQEAQHQSQPHAQSQPDQSFPDNLQQLPIPPPPPPPPQPADVPQQFAYQAHESGTPSYGHDAPSSYSHDLSHKYGQDSPGLYGRDASSRSRGEEVTSFVSEGTTLGPGPGTTLAHPLPPTSRNISELGTSSYSQNLIASHGQSAPPTDVTVPPGMEQPQPPAPPPPPPPAASLPHLSHQQPPQLASQLSPHQQTTHMQPHIPPPQFSFGEPSVPPPYDFHQQPPYEFQQPQPQEYPHPQPPQFNMAPDVPEGAYGGLPHPQTWPPQMPYPANNVGPGIGAGPGLGHQFEYEFEHMHPGHQHPQHLQGHNMFARPPHGPGFRPGGPPLGHFGFGGNPTLGPGGGPGMDFSMFTDNGHGHPMGLERPKKASVPNWLKEELLKKKAAVGGSAQLTVPEDNPRANGDNETSILNKSEFSDRSRSDVSRMTDSDDEDEEDDTEAARTAAMNQEIKRVLTEVLLKVTDDLFDEIAQEVMDEDEQRLLEDPTKKAPIAEEVSGAKAKLSTPHAPVLESAPALAPAPVRVLVAPLVKRIQDDSDDDSESLSSGAPAGNLLGLASYASDDEDAGRNSRQVTEIEHGSGGNSDTEGSELKSVAVEKGGKVKNVDAEDQVVIAKEVKGKKRLSDEVPNLDSSGRSPRRARHTELSGVEASQKDLPTSMNLVAVHQVKSEAADIQNPDMGIAVEGRGLQIAHMKEFASENKSNHNISPHNTERRKEGGYDPSGKAKSGDDASHLRRAEKEGKHKQGVESDVGKKGKDRENVNVKQGAKEAEADGDHKNGIKREKDEKDRVRENKEKDRDRESLRGKERDYSVQKIKERERESDLEKQKEREKDKDRGRSTKSRGRDSDRDRRKSTSEKHDRKSTDHRREEKNSRKAHRRRSSSLSSRSRSRSRSQSESNSASGSRSSSPSPRRGKQQRGRSSKKSSHSSPPSRSRRRTSRSPSRTVPHSKVSHRRHSPSLSREKERNRKSRSASPAQKRRRS